MDNLPEWLVPGALVEFALCVGQVVDVAVSTERVMVLVKSPKGIWRNHSAEWLEYKPEAIKPATPERAARELELYRGYIRKMLTEMDGLADEWINVTQTRRVSA
ncbi:MAG: hypothetical protein HZC40_09600 [Chloroflexi bacterium]|nr:hypothetical protein [Chloroflexota bacterium]